MRSPKEWQEICSKITAGYTPGGRKELTYKSGLELAASVADIWRPGDMIVDIGSGNGRLAMGLYGSGYTGNYTGLEIIRPCVDFCRMAFSGLGNYRFIHVDVRNGRYWPGGAIEPTKVVYPIVSGYADVVFALSVFSHTGTVEIARHIYAEIGRMCKPGGLVFSTWRFGQPDTSERATNYSRSDIEGLFTGFISERRLSGQTPRQTGILCEIHNT